MKKSIKEWFKSTKLSKTAVVMFMLLLAAVITLSVVLINSSGDDGKHPVIDMGDTEGQTLPPIYDAREQTKNTSDNDKKGSYIPTLNTVSEEDNTKAHEEITTKEPDPVYSASVGLSFTSISNGECTVSGIGTCTDVSVIIPSRSPSGEKVTSISERAFSSEKICSVQIPDSVTSIGKGAFAECKNLLFIYVSPTNSSYKSVDGVLYTYDGSTIVAYPSSRNSSYLLIDAKVKQIADMAFYKCPYLKTIKYSGKEDELMNIQVGSGNNAYHMTSKEIVSGGK